MDTLEDTCADILKKARLGAGLSIRGLSDFLGEQPSVIVDVERGGVSFSEDHARALGLDFCKLQHIYSNAYMPKTISEQIAQSARLKTFHVEVGGITANAYVLITMNTHQGKRTKACLLIDSVGVSDEAMSFLEPEDLRPSAHLITHGHFDHTAGTELVKSRFLNIKTFFAGKDVAADGNLSIEGFDVCAYKTPGHSEDDVCYLVNNIIMFVGDSLFAGSVGRPNYDYHLLLENIRRKIFTQAHNTIIAPGHGPITTVQEEISNNPFFKL